MNTILSSRPVQNGAPHHACLCPLSRVVAGTAVRIKRLTAPQQALQRLREMGFCEEQQFKLLSRQPTLICQLGNTRLGLSKELADHIFVEPLPRAARQHYGFGA